VVDHPDRVGVRVVCGDHAEDLLSKVDVDQLLAKARSAERSRNVEVGGDVRRCSGPAPGGGRETTTKPQRRLSDFCSKSSGGGEGV
jgi:hypothetical protein